MHAVHSAWRKPSLSAPTVIPGSPDQGTSATVSAALCLSVSTLPFTTGTAWRFFSQALPQVEVQELPPGHLVIQKLNLSPSLLCGWK